MPAPNARAEPARAAVGGLPPPAVLPACAALAAAVAIAAAGFALHAPERVLARLLALLFLGCGLLAPSAGVALLVLLAPFFVGEEFQAFFWLPESLVYATLAGAGLRLAGARRRPWFPAAPVVLLFLASTVISVPLNLRELVWELRDGTWRTLWEDVRGGHYWANAFYFRMVLDVASGVGLYVLGANLAWSRRTVRQLALALVAVTAALLGLELAIFWGGLPRGGRLLGVFLNGHAPGTPAAFTGPSLNQGYLAHLLAAVFPLAVFVAVDAPRWPGRAVGAGGALVVLTSAALTLQKAVLGVLALEAGLLLAVAGAAGERRARRALLGAGLAAPVGLALAAGLMPQHGALADAFRGLIHSGDPFRLHGLQVAGRMFLDHPWLGVGTGRFIRFFADYSAAPGMDYLWSHDLYAQLLAEQGLLGLAAFLAVVGVALAGVVRRRREAGEAWLAMGCLAVSLAGWLAYGLLHYVFLARSLQLHFWIGLGVLAALGSRARAPARWRPARVVPVVLLLALAFALQLRAALHRPAAEAGLYPSESMFGGMRWTRGTATLDLPVEGELLQVTIGAVGEPWGAQAVTLLLDGAVVQRVTPPAGQFTPYALSVSRPRGARVRLQLRVTPTLVPREAGLGEDPRRLGVMLRPVAWLPRAGG